MRELVVEPLGVAQRCLQLGVEFAQLRLIRGLEFGNRLGSGKWPGMCRLPGR